MTLWLGSIRPAVHLCTTTLALEALSSLKRLPTPPPTGRGGDIGTGGVLWLLYVRTLRNRRGSSGDSVSLAD